MQTYIHTPWTCMYASIHYAHTFTMHGYAYVCCVCKSIGIYDMYRTCFHMFGCEFCWYVYICIVLEYTYINNVIVDIYYSRASME